MKLFEEIKKHFPTLEKRFHPKDLVDFQNTTRADLILYHFTLGLWIRNQLLHPAGSTLFTLFTEYGFTHTDDMSHFIICIFHDYIIRKSQNTRG